MDGWMCGWWCCVLCSAAATDALSIDEYDCKSRYRRAQGRAMLGDIDGARQDYQAIIDE